MNHSVSNEDMMDMHDLIARIERNSFILEEDVRNLSNLIHVIKGDGIRIVKFRRE
ncbi:hypothetical protein MUP01_13110 [Candidatus Bathyarchaeota archaeon]|nr:hypothetical protein [Candidatus Bathyarchaeota archaeon]